MNCLSILGSTGSIGRNTLNVVEMFPDRFSVKALTAKENIELLSDQINRFHPELAVVFEKASAKKLKALIPKDSKTEILYGQDGYTAAAIFGEADTIVSAMVGAAGLMPTFSAIEAGKDIALANKETLVMAGNLVMAAAKQKKVKIRPIDSEHSAIYQCIAGNRKTDLKKIILTASGGPFRSLPANEFDSITPRDALAHPTWQMGTKISIDSATLMNKGLEVIEAKHLFDVSHQMIDVIIHSQSIIHSMVSYNDGSIIAQLGTPDMKCAIAYALSAPERLPMHLPVPDFVAIGSLTFDKPDIEKFPCLALAYAAIEKGGTMPAVLNASNEMAVDAFLKEKINFLQISKVIESTMQKHITIDEPGIHDIVSADVWARQTAEDWIKSFGGYR